MARLVLVHGFTQTRRSWDRIVPALAVRHEVIAVDAPGHGENADVRADLVDAGRLLSSYGPAVFVGYSMGGRLCLHVPPAAMTGLVLVSATAGIEDARERTARRTADDRLADRIEQIGVARFVDEWLAQPLFSGLSPEMAGVAARLTNTAAGLASSLRLAGTGIQAPRWSSLSSITAPALVIAGSRDAKFVALAERLASALPNAELTVIEGAGHTVHLEQPDRFTTALLGWLDRHADSAEPPASSTP